MAVVRDDPAIDTGVARRLWTRDEYYRMAEAGILGPEERVQLIDGEVLVLSPQSQPHATALVKALRVAQEAFGPGYLVRPQLPLALGQYSDPEPDVAVVAGTEDDYPDEHPTTALLVIEVSFSTLTLDRTAKAQLYAGAAIPDYWIVHVNARQLEVLRDPGELPDGQVGYRTRTILKPGQTVRPLAKPDAEIAVESLFPKAR